MRQTVCENIMEFVLLEPLYFRKPSVSFYFHQCTVQCLATIELDAWPMLQYLVSLQTPVKFVGGAFDWIAQKQQYKQQTEDRLTRLMRAKLSWTLFRRASSMKSSSLGQSSTYLGITIFKSI